MNQLENNAYFWQKMDTLLLSSTCKIDHPKGTTHPTYANLIYPVDYGSLQDTVGTDSQPIHVFKGSKKAHQVDSIVISADILKKDCEVKLLVGCDEEEKLRILEFLNQTQFQKAILVQRGSQTPAWANNE
ncbi:Inorganic pyrophosphatase [uncultured Faecalicoccus sp.]|uniref:Inorganic pyrophosphatase n=1 Tax=uncultured Faecalicoccus sp. TaxID=1971760 RepID=UPI00261A7E7E|nr:Inorganic pyrophosphatase [uncultured Faecalicoccus sp.]